MSPGPGEADPLTRTRDNLECLGVGKRKGFLPCSSPMSASELWHRPPGLLQRSRRGKLVLLVYLGFNGSVVVAAAILFLGFACLFVLVFQDGFLWLS